MEINSAITDGTFVEFLRSIDEYSLERHALYKQWLDLCKEYTKAEFRVLLQICQVV
jgi:hypothetical protein